MSVCPDCKGTGTDQAKTDHARKMGYIDRLAYVRCWSCNGNGNDTWGDFMASRQKEPTPTPLQDGFDAALGKGRYRGLGKITPVNPWPAGSKEAAEWEEGWLLTGRGLPK